jgi:sugar-specific transcriptional regulator TrmB
MTDFLDEKRKEMRERLRELEPLVNEYHRLEAAVTALEGVESGGARSSRRAPARGRGRPPGGGGGRGRRRGGQTRASQALALVRDRPGASISELAEAMGIKQNYLYRVLPQLEKEGQVVKRGRGWHPA